MNEHTKDWSIFSKLHNNEIDACIYRNFLDRREIQEILDVYLDLKDETYEVYDGYKAIPRPFDHIPRNPIEDYNKEVRNYLGAMKAKGINSWFHKKLSSLSPDYKVIFNSDKEAITKSATWSSLRHLDLGKGYFEIHCGRLFQDSNEAYYKYFSQKADVDSQLAFLIVLQRPETSCDIEIFDLTWDEVNVKLDKNNLQDKNLNPLPLANIPSERVQLQEGDILIFDEGNYWHLVPPFGGDLPRVSFGGFITRIKDTKEVVVWS